MKKAAFLIPALSLMALASCSGGDFEPKGIDLSIYSSNAYVTENGTSYSSYGLNGADDIGNVFFFSPKGVLYVEVKFGKVEFPSRPTSTYYFDSDTKIHFQLNNRQNNGHFYQENGERYFSFENNGKETLMKEVK